jgi:hypothetical protein
MFNQTTSRSIRMCFQAAIRDGGEQGAHGSPVLLLNRVLRLVVFSWKGTFHVHSFSRCFS